MDLNITKNVNTKTNLYKNKKNLIFTHINWRKKKKRKKQQQQTCDLVLLTIAL